MDEVGNPDFRHSCHTSYGVYIIICMECVHSVITFAVPVVGGPSKDCINDKYFKSNLDGTAQWSQCCGLGESEKGTLTTRIVVVLEIARKYGGVQHGPLPVCVKTQGK